MNLIKKGENPILNFSLNKTSVILRLNKIH